MRIGQRMPRKNSIEEIAGMLLNLRNAGTLLDMRKEVHKSLNFLAVRGDRRYPVYTAAYDISIGGIIMPAKLQYTLNNKWSIDKLLLAVGKEALKITRERRNLIIIHHITTGMTTSSNRRSRRVLKSRMAHFLTTTFRKHLTAERHVQGPMLKWLGSRGAEAEILSAWGIGHPIEVKMRV